MRNWILKYGIFVVSVIFVFSISPSLISNADTIVSGDCGDGVTWNLDDSGVMTISGIGRMEDYSEMVTPWDEYKENITSIILSSGVKSVGSYAFVACENLASISFADSIEHIGERAFYNCTSLTKLKFPDKDISIDNYAFAGCTSLSSIIINRSSISDCNFPDASSDVFHYYYDVEFYYIERFGTVSGKSRSYGTDDYQLSVTPINNYKINFIEYWNDELYSEVDSGNRPITVTMPDSNSTITFQVTFKYNGPVNSCGDNLTWSLDDDGTMTIAGSGDMYDFIGVGWEGPGTPDDDRPWKEQRNNIKKVVFTGNATSIGDYAFSGCTNLTDITIPSSVTSIGERAFELCGFESITIPNTVTMIGPGLFSECSSLYSFVLPNSMTHIYSYMFYNCTSLENITLPDSIISIDGSAFYGCSNLKDLNIPQGVKTIEQDAFSFCESLSSISLPNGVETIGDYAFYGCSGLTELIMPESVNSMGNGVFGECDNLVKVLISDNISNIGEESFYNCNKLNSVIINKEAYNEEAFTDISSINFHFYYNVDYSNDGHGAVEGKTRTYGTDVFELTINPDSGYVLDKITLTSGGNTVELTPDSDGSITLPDAEDEATISASFKQSTEPLFAGHALVLSDEIGVKFRVYFPDNFDARNCYVSFVASDGRTGTVYYSDSEAIEGKSERYFSFGVNALELNEDITATLHYGDNKTVTDTYSVMRYIKTVKESYKNDQKIIDLVNSLHAYGYYMQASGWTDSFSSHKPIPAPEILLTQTDIDETISAVSRYSLAKDDASAGISDTKFSMTMNSKTAINISVKPTDGVTIRSSVFSTRIIDGETYYVIKVSKIGPKNLGNTYVISVETSQGIATYTTSVMAYVNILMNSGKINDNQKLALAAYYYYFIAAKNY